MTDEHRVWLEAKDARARAALKECGATSEAERRSAYDPVRDVMQYGWFADGLRVDVRWDLHKNEPYTEVPVDDPADAHV